MNCLESTLMFHGPFYWLLFTFGVFVLGFFAWLLAAPWIERFTAEHTVCPRDGRTALLVFRRNRDGSRRKLVSCSFAGKGRRITCNKECVAGATGVT